MALNPAVVLVQRWLPRGLAVASVFIALLVLIGLFVAALAVPIINQTNNLQEAAPGYVDKLKKDPTVNDLNKRYHLVSKASAAAGKLPEKVFGAADKLVTGVAETITAIFLTLFLMLELPTLSAGVLSLLPEKRAERVSRLAVDVNRQVGGYVIGNLAISVIAGLVTGISLWILGVPYAAALGILMGVFDLVPLIGATVGAIAAVGVAFAAAGTHRGHHHADHQHRLPASRKPCAAADRLSQDGAPLGVPGAGCSAPGRRAAGSAGRAGRDPRGGLDPGHRPRPARRPTPHDSCSAGDSRSGTRLAGSPARCRCGGPGGPGLDALVGRSHAASATER